MAAGAGHGPVFIQDRCVHLEGHFLGDALLDMVRRPAYSFSKRTWPMVKGFLKRGGAPWSERLASIMQMVGVVFKIQGQKAIKSDPLARTRRGLAVKDTARLEDLESTIRREIPHIVTRAMESQGSSG